MVDVIAIFCFFLMKFREMENVTKSEKQNNMKNV